MTVRELLSRIDTAELVEWMAFYELEPFGYFRRDLEAAMIAQTIANVNRGKGKQPFKLNDFLLKFKADEDERKQSVSEMKSILLAIAKIQNAKVRDEKQLEANLSRPPSRVRKTKKKEGVPIEATITTTILEEEARNTHGG